MNTQYKKTNKQIQNTKNRNTAGCKVQACGASQLLQIWRRLPAQLTHTGN